MSAIVLHLVRPYSSEEEYLEAEAWTIEARAMLLLDQSPMDLDTPVAFELSLENGVKLIRAEGRVGGHIVGNAQDAPALRVRFRRYDSQTKAFIERAVRVRAEQLARIALSTSSLPPRTSSPPKRSQAPSERPSQHAPKLPKAPAVPSFPAAESPEPSGVHVRPAAPVAAPANREELLQRLRARARGERAANATATAVAESTGDSRN